MKKAKLLKLFLSAALAVTTAVTASAAFSKTKTYNGSFTDVAENAWYAKEVASAYELGFMEGMSDTTFSPSTTVTVAQGITMASRVHAVYTGKTIGEVPGGQWYDMYVKYAKDNGIIDENQFDSYTRELKRFEMAELFHDAMPEGYFNAINDVDYIPDVPVGAMYGEKLLTLYNAGIVMGSDDYGTFNPDNSIVRSECAAIINRVAIPENRVKGELVDLTSDNAYTLVYNTSMEGSKEGINSGWVLDNRGGAAKPSRAGFGSIIDVSDKYETAWIREFNFIPKGEIVLDTKISTLADGTFVEYRDVKGDTVYMLKVVDGVWNVLGKDGKFTPVAADNKVSTDNNAFELRVFINLDTGKSTTFINNAACGTHDLLSDNVFSYRVGVDEKGTGTVSMSFVNMVVNYNVYEDFKYFGAEKVYGWETTGDVKLASEQLNLAKDASVVKNFKEADGTVCTEVYFHSKNGADFDFAIGDILTVKSVGKKLFAGDTELYTLTPDMWYRLRVEADTEKGTALVFLNGQPKATVSLAKNEGVSKVTLNAKDAMAIDFLKVYELYEYDDYVPEPEAKASMDDYIVGLNICSLWRNGTHFGWACISPYDEPIPVLGCYDEGIPESADWEIKYMTEHGIDFQAFCWYADISNGPLKEPRNGEQLHNGFQYAKYSDYMKYCILFEASNGAKFNSSQFRKYVVPFWFENYFLDERYMTIENQLVLPIFGAAQLAEASYFGSIAGVKKEFDYLEEVARSYGFDGVLFFACGSSGDNLANMGFDASYAYNWGTAGSSLQVNKDRITSSAKNTKMYTIPTISVGFDSVPWHGVRYDLMSVEDYAAAMDWVKNTYEPENSAKYSWADDFMWLSTWNEYGEGTYIMPAGLNGFGYVDVIREAFTDLPKEHTDVVPTLKQKERITHLYPQYATLLRREGWYTFNLTKEDKANEPANKLIVNGQDVFASSAHEIPPMIENGVVYYPFEPVTALDYILNVYHEWRKDAGTLLIEANGHSVKMLVGSDRYLKDGKEADLGYTLKLVDGIPMLDYKKLCDDLGYTYEEKDGNLYVYSDNYKEVWEPLASRETGVFEFNSVDAEGWASGHMALEVGGGTLKMTTISETRDPIMNLRSGNFPTDFYAGKFKSMEMKIRYKHDGGSNQALSFYYITDVDSSYSENKTLKARLVEDTKGEWQTITFDLTQQANWIIADRITGLRFDPFNAHGEMEIDYIRFIADPDFKYVPVEERPFDVVNGNAEETTVTFYSGNATISRIEDKFKEGNHVWFVDAKAGKQWTYFRHSARYNENATYKIDFDIKLVGNNENDPSALATSYCVNLRYADKGALNDFDHIATTNANISITNGWVHCSTEFKTGKVDSIEKAEFTIYVNPVGDVGFDYYIDNLVVREVGAKYDKEAEIVINENTEGSIVLPEVKEPEVVIPVLKGVITENGSADESDVIKAYSDNADITIVADPDDANNKVFLVTPHEGKKWTYFRYPVETPIRTGVEYKISYDFKYAGNNANNAAIEGSVFHTNVVYNHPDALNGFDHPVSHTKFTPTDGWMHCEVTHVPEATLPEAKKNEFAIYVDPVGDTSVAYYIDNFTVEVVGGEGVVESKEDVEKAKAEAAAKEEASKPKLGVISVNGNAEGKEEPFISDNATITIAVDPDDSANKVWFVEAMEGKRWTYFRYPYAEMQNGVTYKISFDIKYAGNNAKDDSITGTSYSANCVYADEGAHLGENHNNPSAVFTKADGWVHCEYTHTVANMTNTEKSQFAVYTNPVGEVSINYYIDNFVVEAIDD